MVSFFLFLAAMLGAVFSVQADTYVEPTIVFRLSPVETFLTPTSEGNKITEINTGVVIFLATQGLFHSDPKEVRINGFSISSNSFLADKWDVLPGTPPAEDGRIIRSIQILTSAHHPEFVDKHFRVVRIQLNTNFLSYNNQVWPRRVFQIDLMASAGGVVEAKVYWDIDQKINTKLPLSANNKRSRQTYGTAKASRILELREFNPLTMKKNLSELITREEADSLTRYIPGIGSLEFANAYDPEYFHQSFQTYEGNFESRSIAEIIILLKNFRATRPEALIRQKSEIDATFLEPIRKHLKSLYFQNKTESDLRSLNLLEEIIIEMTLTLSKPNFLSDIESKNNILDFLKSLSLWVQKRSSRAEDRTDLNSLVKQGALEDLLKGPQSLTQTIEWVARVANSSLAELQILRKIQVQKNAQTLLCRKILP